VFQGECLLPFLFSVNDKYEHSGLGMIKPCVVLFANDVVIFRLMTNLPVK